MTGSAALAIRRVAGISFPPAPPALGKVRLDDALTSPTQVAQALAQAEAAGVGANKRPILAAINSTMGDLEDPPADKHIRDLIIIPRVSELGSLCCCHPFFLVLSLASPTDSIIETRVSMTNIRVGLTKFIHGYKSGIETLKRNP